MSPEATALFFAAALICAIVAAVLALPAGNTLFWAPVAFAFFLVPALVTALKAA